MTKEEELYQGYANQVMKFLMCITGSYDLSEELTQETIYQAIKSINRYDGTCKLSVWMCQIAKHLYYDYLKKQKHTASVSMDEIAETLFDEQSLEENMIAKEEIMHLQKTVTTTAWGNLTSYNNLFADSPTVTNHANSDGDFKIRVVAENGTIIGSEKTVKAGTSVVLDQIPASSGRCTFQAKAITRQGSFNIDID